MQRPRSISILAALALILLVTNWAEGKDASADTTHSRQHVVVVSDSQAVRYSEQGTDYLMSFIGLVATLRDGQPLRYINSDTPSEIVGLFGSTDPNFHDVQEEMRSRITAPDEIELYGLDMALAEAYSVLGRENAARGSTVYLVSGTSMGKIYDRLLDRLTPLANRFGLNGWSITSVALPGPSEEAVGLLDGLASKTGGEVFELSISDGFRQLTDEILSRGAMGALSEVGSQQMTYQDLMTSVVSIAPGTSETNLLFFKGSPYGSLRLTNPSGLEASQGDRTSSFVIETPHVVIWRITDPTPGDWRIDARGIDGLVSAWEYSSNKLGLELVSSAPIVLGQPDSLVAYVTEGDSFAVVDSVRLMANVTNPEGATITQELKDDGVSPDSAANDGYFTGTLPPLRLEGEHKVALELSWTGFNHKITSQDVFETQAYPAIEVRPVPLGDLKTDERVMVASAFVHVQGEPYPVPVEKLAVSLASTPQQAGLLELVPQRLFGAGPSWEYQVYFTPEDGGAHKISLKLSLEYAGRQYDQISEAIDVRSLAPPLPPVPQVAAMAPAPAQPGPALTPPPGPLAQESQIPWEPMAAIGVLLLALAAFLVYLITRTRPYGYLYNDRDEPLVDLSMVKRQPVLGFLFRSTLRGKEVGVPGLEGVVFQFAGKRIRVRSLKGQSAIRVNNQPLIGQMPIEDRTWIGAHGRLYNFLVSPDPGLGGAAAGGD